MFGWDFNAQGIEFGQQVSAHPVGTDQHQSADRVERRLADFDPCHPGFRNHRHHLRLGLRAGRHLFGYGCEIPLVEDAGVRRRP